MMMTAKEFAKSVAGEDELDQPSLLAAMTVADLVETVKDRGAQGIEAGQLTEVVSNPQVACSVIGILLGMVAAHEQLSAQ